MVCASVGETAVLIFYMKKYGVLLCAGVSTPRQSKQITSFSLAS